jgi:hypothetical protein
MSVSISLKKKSADNKNFQDVIAWDYHCESCLKFVRRETLAEQKNRTIA